MVSVLEAAAGIERKPWDLAAWTVRDRCEEALRLLRIKYNGKLPSKIKHKRIQYVTEPKPGYQPQPKHKKVKVIDVLIKEFYDSFAWRNLRYGILVYYGNKCMCCGNSNNLRVDHIKPLPRYWDLRFDVDNLQILCDPCNRGKGSWDETDWRPKGHRRKEEPED